MTLRHRIIAPRTHYITCIYSMRHFIYLNFNSHIIFPKNPPLPPPPTTPAFYICVVCRKAGWNDDDDDAETKTGTTRIAALKYIRFYGGGNERRYTMKRKTEKNARRGKFSFIFFYSSLLHRSAEEASLVGISKALFRTCVLFSTWMTHISCLRARKRIFIYHFSFGYFKYTYTVCASTHTLNTH